MEHPDPPSVAVNRPAARVARLRRTLFFNLVMLLTLLATWVLADILWRGGLSRIELGMLLLFVPLFALVSVGFLQALIGFILLARGGDRHTPMMAGDRPPPPDALPVTAVVLPIHNEDVTLVYEGLRTTYLSLIRAGYHERFDFFILSDTGDLNRSIEEEVAWVELCKQVRGFGRIFYRKRRAPLNRKSGNIGDFCRRWGRKYPYMIVLDADSVMDARALVKLVALMEANPRTGIIQTAPQLVLGETLFARLMQFASSLYGPIFAAGLNFWQQGEGNYWGHNAILRVAPFMDHCALPELPGSRRAKSRFMSHDYVEAALMRQAGYAVWLAADVEGSYEGGPPTLLDSAKRDRRWCLGNLQHAWLLARPGIHPLNRLHLLLGILSYAAAPLWLSFLILGTAQGAIELQPGVFRSFDYDVGLTSFLDIGGNRLALLLFWTTMGMLLTPKVLALLLALRNRVTRATYGGIAPLLGGLVIEQLVATLLAPVQMLFNTQFVASVLAGRPVHWVSQARDSGDGLDWRTAILTHGAHTVIGAVWALVAWSIHPLLLAWQSPIVAGLCLSIPLEILLSKPSLGRALARLRLLSVPTERAPPPVLKHLSKNLAAAQRLVCPPELQDADAGLMQAVIDPYINAVHVALRGGGRAAEPPARRDYLQRLEQRFLSAGPSRLTRKEQRVLLLNPDSMARLHAQLWRTPGQALAPWWNAAIAQYNLYAHQPLTHLYR